MSANSALNSTNDEAKLTAFQSSVSCEISADTPALSTSDTSSRNAIDSTIPNESTRLRSQPQTAPPGFGRTSQIVFSAAWSCANTPVAENTSVATPSAAANVPVLSLRFAASITSATASPPCIPTSPVICDTTWSCAFGSSRPAILITISTSGASESAV
jgi:hypothetical protein